MCPKCNVRSAWLARIDQNIPDTLQNNILNSFCECVKESILLFCRDSFLFNLLSVSLLCDEGLHTVFEDVLDLSEAVIVFRSIHLVELFLRYLDHNILTQGRFGEEPDYVTSHR